MDTAAALQLQQRCLGASIRMVAHASPVGELIELDGVTAAINPACSERSIVNSAVYRDAGALEAALPILASAYAEAGVRASAVWTIEPEPGAIAVLEDAGYVLDSEPAAMCLDLSKPAHADPGELDWDAEAAPAEVGRVNDLAYAYPDGEGIGAAIGDAPPGVAVRSYRARVGGEVAAVLQTADVGSDCFIAWVATLQAHRGNGLASRLLTAALDEARERGLRTSTLQASMLGRGVYERLGYSVVSQLQLHEKRE